MRNGVIAILTLAGLWTAVPAFADTIFLQDGRTIDADQVEVMADRVRIQRQGRTIELPRSDVLSVHVAPPPAAPQVPPPAVYPNFVEQMTDRVRSEIGAGVNRGPNRR